MPHPEYKQMLSALGLDVRGCWPITIASDSSNCRAYSGTPKDPEHIMLHDGKKDPEPSAKKERENREYSCRDTKVKGELAYGFLCNYENRKWADGGRKEECLKLNPLLKVMLE